MKPGTKLIWFHFCQRNVYTFNIKLEETRTRTQYVSKKTAILEKLSWPYFEEQLKRVPRGLLEARLVFTLELAEDPNVTKLTIDF
jgi:hypothetical protein